MGKIDRVADEKPAVGIRGNPVDQTPVDLDDLRRITQQIQYIGMTGAEIIYGDLGLGAGFAYLFQAVQFIIGSRVIFREFKDKAVQETFILGDERSAVLLAEEVTRNGIDKNLCIIMSDLGG